MGDSLMDILAIDEAAGYTDAKTSAVAARLPSLQGNAMVRKMAYPTTVISPAPTFSISATPTLAVNKSPYWEGLRPFGSTLFRNGLGASSSYPRGPLKTDGSYAVWDGSWGSDFDYDGQALEFKTQYGGDRAIRVWSDEVPHSQLPQLTTDMVAGGTANSNYWFKCDFGSAKRRRIRLEFQSTSQMIFSGLQHAVTDSVIATSMASPLIVWVTDSYGHGIAPAGQAPIKADSYPNIVSKLLGFSHHFNATSVPSTGIVKTNPGATQGNYRSRYDSDVIPFKPDIVVIQGSINDTDSWPLYQGQVGPEFLLGVQQLRAALPNVKIIATSPIYAGTPSAAHLAVRDEVKVVCEANGIPYIDAMSANAPVFSGTGRTNSLKADGNADRYMSSDATHANGPGHHFLAPWMASQMAPILGQSL